MGNFALIGAAGFVAPRHLRAIKETGNVLVAAFDPNDSVGVLDSYFPDAHFFTEFERFDRHLDKSLRKGEAIEFVSICSPNYLHDAHVRYSLRIGANSICEKPLVLNPWNIDGLARIAHEQGRRVYTILQLRLHPAVVELRRQVLSNPDKVWDIDLTYITSRGRWYHASWKGDTSKSGGVATNIGIHFFDMLLWIFGRCERSVVHLNKADYAAGFLLLKQARVRWFLSIDSRHLPENVVKAQKRTFRSIKLGEDEFEFSEGFTDLHTDSYRHVLSGSGFDIEDARASIEAAHSIRNAAEARLSEDFHPYCNLVAKP